MVLTKEHADQSAQGFFPSMRIPHKFLFQKQNECKLTGKRKRGPQIGRPKSHEYQIAKSAWRCGETYVWLKSVHFVLVSAKISPLGCICICRYTCRFRSICVYFNVYTSSTAQGGGGSFKNRKPIGELGCCESGMAERSH